jgi:imidazoleglycerol-phosphate dehydratase/histidinol-phosphatase
LVSANNWHPLIDYILHEARKASIQRKTNETDIELTINLDGTGKADISTGLKFFDHMLDQIARHGLIDLTLKCEGDLEVDEHHTIEDVAIALGEAISNALGNKKGIERYGFVLPMDEAQATVAIDLSGRPYLVFEGEFKREYVGDLPTEMVKHFFYSLAMNLKATLHVSFVGENDHHKIEACFKGLARALKMAIEQNGRIKNLVPSSKGTL